MRRFLVPVLALAGLSLAQENYTTNWSGHKTLHINTSATSATGTALSANVLRYPMLVRLTAKDSAVFAASKGNGADIRFTKANNTTRRPHQIDRWDSAGRKAEVWVLMDTVFANNQTQQIRMHWGNAGAADSSSGAAVFDSAVFYAAWHMGDSTGNKARPNSVVGGNSAMPAASSGNLASGFVPVEGVIGKADTLRNGGNSGTVANEDHFTLGSGYEFPNSTGSMSLWVKMPSAFADGNFLHFMTLSAGTSGGLNDNIWMGRTGNSFRMRTSNGIAEGSTWTASGALLPLTSWAHFTTTWHGPQGRNKTWYKNGVMIGDGAGANGFTGLAAPDSIDVIHPITRGRTYIGRSAWGDRNFRGAVDEVRIAKTALSADWVKLDYASQNPSAILVTDSVKPAISYSTDSVKTTLGFGSISIPAPLLSGVPHPTVTISPDLPAGLTLSTGNTNRGMISGTPTVALAKTKFIITATNTIGGVAQTATDSIWITVTAPSVTEDYSTWTGTKTVSFNSPAAGSVSAFPLLVRLTSADAAVFSAGRASLRFSKTDGTKLNYSIDTWDSAGQKASVWVLVDNVTAGANSVRLHWGKAGAVNQSNPSGVFSRQNGFVAVHHLGNAPDTAARPNSVDTANAALPIGFGAGYQPRTGLIGMADSLANPGNTLTKANGGDYLNFGVLDTTVFSANGAATLSIWVKATSLPGAFMQYYTLGNVVGQNATWVGKNGSGTLRLAGQSITAGTNDGVVAGGNNSALVGRWQHVSLTVDGSVHKLYSNGALLATNTVGQGLARINRTANFIGAATWTDPTFDGIVDEARTSNVARSADWIALEYATQQLGAAPTTLSYPALVNARPNLVLTAVTPTVTGAPANFSVSGTLPAGVTFNDTTGVFSGTPTVAGKYALTVTANAGAWSVSSPVTFSIGDPDGAYATAWTGHKFMNVNTNAIVTPSTVTLQKFPILVRLGAADSLIFNASQADGADVRFTKTNDVTRLHHEIDLWDKANKRAAVWVLLDTVYGSSSGTRFKMHYGNATVADSSNGGKVFDSTNYAAVLHLGGANGTVARPNSVPGANPATPANFQAGYAPSQGIIGLADSLGVAGNNTAGSHLSFGPTPVGTVKNGKVTLSLWVKKNAFTQVWRHALSLGSGAPNQNFWFGTTGDEAGAFRLRTAEGTTEQTAVNVSGFWLENTWQHVFATFDGSAVKVYGNGVQAGEGDIGHTLADVNRTLAYIGRAPWTADGKFLGVFDEVRVTKSALTAPWIKLEYENQKPTGSTVVTLGDAFVPPVVGLNAANALTTSGPALGFKRFGQGLMFQVRSEVASNVRLSIIDMHGRTIWNHTASTTAGMNQISWNGRSNNGQEIGSGIFAVRMSLLDENGKPAASLVRRVPLTR